MAAPIAAVVAKRAALELLRDGKPVQKLAFAALALLGFIVFLLMVVLLPVILLSSMSMASAGGAYPANSGIPEEYWPTYTAAAEAYAVSPYLLASIHKQE